MSTTRLNGAHVPVTDDSPRRVSSAAAAGWRAEDAPLAAAWFAAAVDGAQPPSVRASVLTQVTAGTDAAAAEKKLAAEAEAVEAERAEVHSDGPDQEAWMPDMRIVGYVDEGADDGAVRSISVWGRSDSSPARWWTRTLTVEWSGEDWQWSSDPWPSTWAEKTPPDDVIPYMEGAR